MSPMKMGEMREEEVRGGGGRDCGGEERERGGSDDDAPLKHDSYHLWMK